MKTSLAVCAMALLANFALAQDTTGSSQDTQKSQSSSIQPSGKSVSELRFSKLQGATAKSSDGQNLGKIEDLMFDKNGKITFAIMSPTGTTGAQKLVPVPWQALNVQSEQDYVVNIDQKKWASAPSLSNNQYTDRTTLSACIASTPSSPPRPWARQARKGRAPALEPTSQKMTPNRRMILNPRTIQI